MFWRIKESIDFIVCVLSGFLFVCFFRVKWIYGKYEESFIYSNEMEIFLLSRAIIHKKRVYLPIETSIICLHIFDL